MMTIILSRQGSRISQYINRILKSIKYEKSAFHREVWNHVFAGNGRTAETDPTQHEQINTGPGFTKALCTILFIWREYLQNRYYRRWHLWTKRWMQRQQTYSISNPELFQEPFLQVMHIQWAVYGRYTCWQDKQT